MYGEKLFSIDLKSAPIQGLHAADVTSNINVMLQIPSLTAQ